LAEEALLVDLPPQPARIVEKANKSAIEKIHHLRFMQKPPCSSFFGFAALFVSVLLLRLFPVSGTPPPQKGFAAVCRHRAASLPSPVWGQILQWRAKGTPFSGKAHSEKAEQK
jgi:hypothetical protein